MPQIPNNSDNNNNQVNQIFNLKNKWVYLFLAAIVIFLLYTFSSLVITLILSFVIAYFLQPLQKKLNNLKIPPILSALVVLALFISLIVVLSLLFSSLITHTFNRLSTNYPVIIAQLQTKLAPIFQIFGVDINQANQASIIAFLKQEIPKQAKNITDLVMLSIKQSSSFVAGIITNIILLPAISFYLLLDWKRLQIKSSLLVPKHLREKVNHFLHQVNRMMHSYQKGQLLLMLCLAVFYILGLKLINIDKAAVIGLFSCVSVLVPYVGFLCSFSLALLIGLLQFGFTAHILFIVLLYGIGQLLEGFILTPRLVGESIGLHPITVLIALIIFGQLLGFIGMLFALPLAGLVQLIIKECYKYYRTH
jgi:predicted PurR-regulated permease PerM